MPPPLPLPLRRRGRKVGIAAAVVGTLIAACFAAFVVLRLSGLIGIYRIPTASMAPAVNRDDSIFVEGITYRSRRPMRGEIIAFKTDGLRGMRAGEKYIKRMVGLPGDRLRISGGTLYVNDQPAAFRNKEGEVHYTTGLGTYLRREDEEFVVPVDGYFVLGDNSPNSADSRMWGVVPASAVIGRALFCYSPGADAGWIR